MEQVKIGKNLKKIREENNLSIEDLAKKLDISSKFIKKWENDEENPNLQMLSELSKVYNTDLLNLITEKNKKINKNTQQEVIEKIIEYESCANRNRILELCVDNICLLILSLTIFFIYITEYNTKPIFEEIFNLFIIVLPGYICGMLIKILKINNDLGKYKVDKIGKIIFILFIALVIFAIIDFILLVLL